MKPSTNPRTTPAGWFGGTAKLSTLLALGSLLLFSPSNARAVVETFNTETNFSWQAPIGVTNVQVEIWGGGGAGGAAQYTFVADNGNCGGGGGAGGAYAMVTNVPVTPGAFYNITIPAAATAPAGSAQGSRFDGATVTFTGDSAVTVTAVGGQGGESKDTTTGNEAGLGGTGSDTGCVGDALFRGGNGAQRPTNNGGPGGGGAGNANPGGDATSASATGGTGGIAGGGNGGNGRSGAGNGNAGSSPGGGGAGAKSQYNGTTQFGGSRAGGVGGLGQIVLTYTLPPSGTVKANNANNLDQASSWTAGVPSNVEAAIWNSTVTSANTVLLGSDLTFGGITISNPVGLVTIDAGNTVTLGTEAVDINMSAATADLTLNCALLLGGPNTWDVASGRTLTLGGQVSGAQPVIKQGAGKVILSNTLNDYSGATTISGGTLQLGATQVIGPSELQIDAGATFDMNGFDETLARLNSSGTIDNTTATPVTLTLPGGLSQVINGGIKESGGGSLTLNKSAGGSLVLNGTNSHSGGTVFGGGTMSINNSFALGTGLFTVNGTRVVLDADVNITNAVEIGSTGAQATRGVIEASGSAGTTATLSGPINIVATPVAGAGHFGGNPGTLVVSGPIASTVDVKQRLGTVIYSGGGAGYTSMTVGGTARLGANNGLATTASLQLGYQTPGVLDLNGFNQTLAGITPQGSAASNGTIGNSSTNSDSTLTITGTSTYDGTIAGALGGGTKQLHLVVTTGAALTLSGTNSLQDSTTVNGGSLTLTLPSLSTNSTVIVTNGGTVALTFAGGETNDVAALVINGVSKAPGVYDISTDPAAFAGSTGGSLQVVAPAAPATPGNPQNIQVVGGNLIFSVTNSSGTYRVQGATNLASPVWVDVATNAAPFSFTNNANLPQQYFRTVTP